MLQPLLVSKEEELRQILRLQQKNLVHNISPEESKSQGFVTMHHDMTVLHQMHKFASSVIIKENDEVVAYALTMLKECRHLMPELSSMFELFDRLSWKGKPLNEYRYYVVGQICVAKAYRGMGLVETLYRHHRQVYQQRFDLFLTEIATRNIRSIKAHEKVGFQIIHIYKDALDEWAIVGWDWS